MYNLFFIPVLEINSKKNEIRNMRKISSCGETNSRSITHTCFLSSISKTYKWKRKPELNSIKH